MNRPEEARKPRRGRKRAQPKERIKKEKPAVPGAEKKKMTGRIELYFGPRKSGKTTLFFRRLTSQFFTTGGKIRPNNQYFILIQPSFDGNTAYKGFEHIKKLFKGKQGEQHYEYSSRMSEYLKALFKKLLKKKLQPVVIIDDVGGDSFIKYGKTDDNVVEYLAKQASHMPPVVICLFQRFVQASNTLRGQADTIHFFKTENKPELVLYNNTYFGTMGFREFIQLWRKLFINKFDYVSIDNLPGGEKEIYLNDKKHSFI